MNCKGEVYVVALVSSLSEGLGGRERGGGCPGCGGEGADRWWQPATRGPEASCKKAQKFREFWIDRRG